MGSSCSNASSAKVEDINFAGNDEPIPPPPVPKHPQEPVPPTQPTQSQLQPIANKAETQNGDIEEFENEMDLAGNKPETIPGNNGPNQLRIEPEISPYKAERFDVDEQQEWRGPVKLVYFAEFRLRAEMSRLILRYAEEPYEDILISRAEWPSYKDSTPMGILPVLKTEKGELCQSTAIARYLARENGLAGKNNWDSAQMDMLIGGMVDLIEEIKPVFIEQDEGKRGDLWRQAKEEILTPFLEKYTKFFQDNPSGWFVGDQLSWVDLAISDFLSTLSNKWDNTLLDDFSTLRNHTEAVLALPAIQQYLSERPDLPI